MDFLALDVETANANMASICEIGVASYSGGRAVDEWKSYVDPEDYFDGINVSIHGIDEAIVRGAPTFIVVAGLVGPMLLGQIVVTHTPFDQVAISQAYNRYKLDVPHCTWLDSAGVARRAWKECATSGYGLSSVCDLIGYQPGHTTR